MAAPKGHREGPRGEREGAEGGIHRHLTVEDTILKLGFLELLDKTLTNFQPVLVKNPVSVVLFGVR